MPRPIESAMLMTAVALASLPAVAGATAQYPEKLIYKGKTLPLFSEPLEGRLASYWDEPAFGPPRRRPARLRATSTACWRGYVGTWRIERGQLWLAALHTCGGTDRASAIPIGEVLPGEKLPLRASWFTGILRVPLGKQLVYVHMGYHSVYEQDLLIAVRYGKVEGERKVDNRGRTGEPGGFRVRPTESELARTLMDAADALQRCARLGRQRGEVEILVQPDGSVGRIRLGGTLPSSPPGRCLFGVLPTLRYPAFFGPPVTTRHQLP